MYREEFRPGQTIIKQGEQGDMMYILERGRMDVFVDSKNVGNVPIAGCFGELALLYDVPRAATVVVK